MLMSFVVMALLLSVLPAIVIRVRVAVTMLLVPSVPLVELPWVVIGSRLHVLEKLVTEEDHTYPD